MLDDNAYNLIMQLTQESKTLWRIKNNYKMNAKFCPECRAFWEELEREGEQRVDRIERLLKDHMPHMK